MLLGVAEKRKLWNFGASYSHRLFHVGQVDWGYEAEFSPLVLEGDPKSRYVNAQTSPTNTTTVLDGAPLIFCAPIVQPYDFTDPKGVHYQGLLHIFCHDRQWTVGQAMSPVGVRWNVHPRGKLQATFAMHAGYMYTTRPVPDSSSGSFNFHGRGA